MARPDYDPTNIGVCKDLPLPVVDKYFGADAKSEPFLHRTAAAMCGRCLVQAECLLDAISVGPWNGFAAMTRGGQTAHAIDDLKTAVRRGADPDELVDQVLSARPRLGNVDTKIMRLGVWPDSSLLA